MTSRDRVLASLNHKQPDTLPVDFGASGVTGIHVSVVAALRKHYGLGGPVKVGEPYQMLGLVDDDLRKAMGVDVEGVPARKTMFGFPNEDWKLWRTPDGLDVLVPGGFNVTVAGNGDTLIYPEGDVSVPPSARMPEGGYFFDSIPRQEPIDENRLDPQDNLEEFGPLEETDLAYYRTETAGAMATGRAVMAGFGGMAMGDIALVPAPFLKHPKGIRDVAEWYMATTSRRDYVHAVFAAQTEIAIANLERIAPLVRDQVDVVYVCGTDFGTQTSAFCSEQTFRDLYLPYYSRINGWIHAHTQWKTFKHSCGSVARFLDAFIDAGFDILNPVQCSAVGMEARSLKERYGERLTFWGGGVDTQRTLPFGSPEEVRRQVLERCEIFARDGGYVFSTIHNIQARTPTENVLAMIEALREFNG